MKNKILAFLIIFMLSFSLFAEEQKYTHGFIKTKTEWFSFALGYGTYGLSGHVSVCTLRWHSFFWETLRIQSSYDFITQNAFALRAETASGIPFFLTDDNRHEIRISAGLSLGAEFFKNSFSSIDALTEVSYVFHISDEMAFQIGAAAKFPFGTGRLGEIECGEREENCNKIYYMPNIYGFAGVRF